jgi:hypothetical protein
MRQSEHKESGIMEKEMENFMWAIAIMLILITCGVGTIALLLMILVTGL